MKKIISIFSIFSFLFFLINCKKETHNQWDIEITKPVPKVQITDISKDLYNPNLPLEEFSKKYPWFQGSVSNEDFKIRRQDTAEIKIYKTAISKINIIELNKQLQELFSHMKYYFPTFKNPQIYFYSSALQGAKDPIFFKPNVNLLFVDITGFMGENNFYYKGLDLYIQKSMNPENIIPKLSQILEENMVPINQDHQKFIDQLIYNGKLMTLQDAFLPSEPEYLKINYTKKQYDWAKANEANVWNYFVENNHIFSDDNTLVERFISPGPFSKFYTEIDRESSPQIGIFTGWQICRNYFKNHPETKLQDFLKMNATEIFNQSEYKPKN